MPVLRCFGSFFADEEEGDSFRGHPVTAGVWLQGCGRGKSSLLTSMLRFFCEREQRLQRNREGDFWISPKTCVALFSVLRHMSTMCFSCLLSEEAGTRAPDISSAIRSVATSECRANALDFGSGHWEKDGLVDSYGHDS